MQSKVNWLQELKNLGATDEQLKQLKNLQDLYKSNDTYNKIEKLNKQLLGERVRPVTISYENAYRMLNYNVYNTIQGIIDEYRRGYSLVEQGTTSEFQNYINTLAEELQDIGVYNATVSSIQPSMLEDIEYYYTMYKRYEDTGNSNGMSYAREKIISIIGG